MQNGKLKNLPQKGRIPLYRVVMEFLSPGLVEIDMTSWKEQFSFMFLSETSAGLQLNLH